MKRLLFSMGFIVVLSLELGSAKAATIDVMHTNANGGSAQEYTPSRQGLIILGKADDCQLSNGGTWSSDAGSFPYVRSWLAREVVEGNVIHYRLETPPEKVIFQNTGDHSGEHSVQGILRAVDQLVLKAEIGSTTAIISGFARILSNKITCDGEPGFYYFSASDEEMVPFQAVYALTDGATWQSGLFEQGFAYTVQGRVDFATVVPEPNSAFLILSGLILFGRKLRARHGE